MEGTASEADCRICGETCATSELVVPCGCKGTAAYAHRKCIQRWISTPKPKCAGRASDRCEVCGEAWRGDYDIPVIQTEEQTSFEDSTENVEALLYAAHARTLAGAELLSTMYSSRPSAAVSTDRGRDARARTDA